MLSKSAIQEFQAIYNRKFGKNISFAEAESKGMALLRLYKAVCKTHDNIPTSNGNDKNDDPNRNIQHQ
jgi:hypothetical protein